MAARRKTAQSGSSLRCSRRVKSSGRSQVSITRQIRSTVASRSPTLLPLLTLMGLVDGISLRQQGEAPASRALFDELPQLNPGQLGFHMMDPVHGKSKGRPVHEPSIVVMGARFRRTR